MFLKGFARSMKNDFEVSTRQWRFVRQRLSSMCNFTSLVRVIIIVHVFIDAISLAFNAQCADDVSQKAANRDANSARVEWIVPSENERDFIIISQIFIASQQTYRFVKSKMKPARGGPTSEPTPWTSKINPKSKIV